MKRDKPEEEYRKSVRGEKTNEKEETEGVKNRGRVKEMKIKRIGEEVEKRMLGEIAQM